MVQLFVSILDEAIHTPATTFGRCPFLFTVGMWPNRSI